MTKTILSNLNITDVNPAIIGGMLEIEVNGKWRKYPAADFFEFLCPDYLCGHDPKEEIAWVQADPVMVWNPARQEYEEYVSPWTHSSRSYEDWLRDFIDDDDLLLKYVKTAQVVK